MSDLFDSITQGLIEAIEYERGNLPDVRVDKAWDRKQDAGIAVS